MSYLRDFPQFTDNMRRDFRYRCGFCGIAESLLDMPGSFTTIFLPNDQPVYVCRFCNSAHPGPFGENRVPEHRNEKSYHRHLRFRSDGRLVGLTSHGESLIVSMDLNDPRKVRLRHFEYRVRTQCTSFIRRAQPLVTRLIERASAEALVVAEELNRALLAATRDLKRLPEPIDSVYSRKELAYFDCISAEKRLTPFLIKYLRRNPEDILKIPPNVFEELVAEFFAGQGFHVRLVGRDSRTGADVVALKKIDPFGVEIRYLIEVKRWREKVGIEEVRKVAGTLALERHKHGWHLALLVSAGGFRDLRSTDTGELTMLGIELRDKESLLDELRTYKPRLDGGLWLNYGWDDRLAGVHIK